MATAINESVTAQAPDVPLELFWAMSTKAEAETPMELVSMADKLDWQIKRSVQLAREVMNRGIQPAVAAATQVQQVQRQGQVVMAPGSTTSGVGSPQAGPTRFVDAVKQLQARKVT